MANEKIKEYQPVVFQAATADIWIESLRDGFGVRENYAYYKNGIEVKPDCSLLRVNTQITGIDFLFQRVKGGSIIYLIQPSDTNFLEKYPAKEVVKTDLRRGCHLNLEVVAGFSSDEKCRIICYDYAKDLADKLHQEAVESELKGKFSYKEVFPGG
jgi:hypothetical protein